MRLPPLQKFLFYYFEKIWGRKKPRIILVREFIRAENFENFPGFYVKSWYCYKNPVWVEEVRIIFWRFWPQEFLVLIFYDPGIYRDMYHVPRKSRSWEIPSTYVHIHYLEFKTPELLIPELPFSPDFLSF
jgi:hypothetical protein